MSALTEVIDIFVYDDGASDDRMLSNERDEVIRHRRRHLPVRPGLDVAEVADVTIVVRRSAVLLAEWIEVRTGGSAAVRQIAELSNEANGRDATSECQRQQSRRDAISTAQRESTVEARCD